jgi:hypothetical protein
MPESTFEELEAAELLCPKCQKPVPVRKILLLILPEGDKYDYLCAYCATSVGTKTISRRRQSPIIVTG